MWSPENSFAFVFDAMPSADGILNIVMQQHIGGEDPPGGDNNPILQGVIVHGGDAPNIIPDRAVARFSLRAAGSEWWPITVGAGSRAATL